uniref:Uncharacterized protein n=1 Tax=Arundo donax TaxID=35708 RepID=A0A0A9EDF9_ARUDO
MKIYKPRRFLNQQRQDAKMPQATYHTRKKSKHFPTLMLSKSMDSSYEPMTLKKMKTSRDQFGVEQSSLHADGVTPMDSEPIELRLSPVNTAEVPLVTRTSENSRMPFACKMDSPSEKTKMLHTMQDESSLRFEVKRRTYWRRARS